MPDIERVRPETEGMLYEFGRTLLFNPQTQEFIIGNRDETAVFPLRSITDISAFNTFIPDGLDSSKNDYLLVMAGFDIYVMPRFRKYMEELDSAHWFNLREYICKVIQKVYKLKKPGHRAPISYSGFIGINATLRENGNFVLQTMGNAASVGPKGYGTDPEERTSDFPHSYDMGNADTEAQRLSLYAGIGALAWIVENGIPEDKPMDFSKVQQLGMALE